MASSSGNGNGNWKKPIPFPANPADNPANYAFLLELYLANGNASAAARQIGWSDRKGRKFVEEHPELLELIEQAAGRLADHQLIEWQAMQMEARQTIRANLKAEDERTRQRAAEFIIERVEGKAPQTVVHETPQVEWTSVLFRFLAAMHLHRGISIGEALSYAEGHPEEVEAWGQSRGLLPAGTQTGVCTS